MFGGRFGVFGLMARPRQEATEPGLDELVAIGLLASVVKLLDRPCTWNRVGESGFCAALGLPRPTAGLRALPRVACWLGRRLCRLSGVLRSGGQQSRFRVPAFARVLCRVAFLRIDGAVGLVFVLQPGREVSLGTGMAPSRRLRAVLAHVQPASATSRAESIVQREQEEVSRCSVD